MFTDVLSRREALAAAARTMAAGAGGVIAATFASVADAAQVHGAVAAAKPTDAWLRKLAVPHKMLFDSPDPNGGVGLAHLLDYYDTYNGAYGVRDAEIRGVFTFYGGTTPYALNDAMWAKYRLGELLRIDDPGTGSPAAANPWRDRFIYRGAPHHAASIDALLARGAIFLVCNSALVNYGRRIAQANGLEANAVYEELKANVLPGLEIVPSMVISIEQAHRAGAGYQRK